MSTVTLRPHTLVATLGLLLNVVVHPADVQDSDSCCSNTFPPHLNVIPVRAIEGEVTKKLTGVSRGEIQRAFGARPWPRKKRTRLEPRQYTLVDLERARDRVEAAHRRVDNDRTKSRGRAGLERAQLDLCAIESELRRRGIIE